MSSADQQAHLQDAKVQAGILAAPTRHLYRRSPPTNYYFLERFWRGRCW